MSSSMEGYDGHSVRSRRVRLCVSYISKAQKRMSELLRKAVEEARERNTNIKQQVCDIGIASS